MTGLLAVAVVAVAVVLLVVKPFDGPASSPGELVTEPPSSAPSLVVIAGETPMASPAPEPTSAIRTIQPLGSEPPATDAPGPTMDPGSLDLPTCHSDAGAFTVSYPEGWNTLSDGSPWSCMLFDPQPILITPDSELPDVSVMARVEAVPYAQLVKAYRTQPTAAVLQEESGTIAGRDATAFELENNGSGYFEKGVLETLVILDNGDAGSLVLEAVGTPGVLYDARLEGLGVIVGSLAFD